MSNHHRTSSETPERMGRYIIIDVLGQGGMGRVYLAEDPVLKRKLAIKVIAIDDFLAQNTRTEFIDRFLIEARATAQLSHPSIVTVHDAGEEDGLPWIAFEYVEGESLEELLYREGKVVLSDALRIIGNICSALTHAHEHNIIHRDIKPANILLHSSGIAKLADFGIAKAPWAGITQEGVTVGTPGYMSPEQISGKPIDGRSDLFSLATVFYELISGKHPFVRDTMEQTIQATLSESYENLSEFMEISPRIEYAIARGLTASPEKRISSAQELLDILTSIDTTDHEFITPQTSVSQIHKEQNTGIATRVKHRNDPDRTAPRSSDLAELTENIGRTFSIHVSRITGAMSHSMQINKPLTRKEQLLLFLAFLVIFSGSLLYLFDYARTNTTVPPVKQLKSMQTRLSNDVVTYLLWIVNEGTIDEALDACQKLIAAGYECPRERLLIESDALLKKNELEKVKKISDYFMRQDTTLLDGLLIAGNIEIRESDYDNAFVHFSTLMETEAGKAKIQDTMDSLVKEFASRLKLGKAPASLKKLVILIMNDTKHPQFNEWINDKNYWLRWNTVHMLDMEKVDVDMVEVYILDLHYAGSWKTRKQAALELGDIGDPRAIPALEAAQKKGIKDPLVSSAARSVLVKKFDR